MPDPKPEPKPKPKPAADAAAPVGPCYQATVSHYRRQEDGTLLTYGRGSVIPGSVFPPDELAFFLADGRLLPVDLAPVRLDPHDGIYGEPRSPLHAED